MQNHCKNQNGASVNDTNSCGNCGISLTTVEEASLHKSLCNGTHKTVIKTQTSAGKGSKSCLVDDRYKKWENQILTFGQAFCDNQECNFVGMSLSDLKAHIKSCTGVPNFNLFCCIHCRCGFASKDDHIKHQQNCNITIKFDNSAQKRDDSLHFRVIKRMKSGESGENHIIQAMPDFPKGQYRRRRPYSVQHIKSWVLSLEKFKYVKCMYQNCYFLAMSLEDMISHFGYCNGDGGFAKFVCPYCTGRVTSETILRKHIERSHPLENNHIVSLKSFQETHHIKVEPQTENNDSTESNGMLFTDMESQVTETSNEEIPQNPDDSQQSQNEVTRIRQAACWRVWKYELSQFGYAFCRKSLCNFMAPSISGLEVHLRNCDGTPDFEWLNCPKCRYRLPTREDLVQHMPKCSDEGMKYSPNCENEVVSPREGNDTREGFEVGPVFRLNEGKQFKSYSKQNKGSSTSTPEPPQPEENHPDEEQQPETNATVVVKNPNATSPEVSSPKKRGRPRVSKQPEKPSKNTPTVKCGKCGAFEGSRKSFDEHNMKIHVGLGWVEGETPVDMNDEKLLVRLVKEAFKLSKKATCEKCDVLKRSVLGFVSHIQNCGKTEEEKNALKVQCPYCEGKYLKYSLGTHMKLCRSGPQEEEERTDEREKSPEPSGRRRSAIKAVSKFQQVLSDNDEGEQSHETHYILYEKGKDKMPKLNSKLNNVWYKLKREKKKIPCRHDKCKNMSRDVREAKNHHYTCSFLPDKVYLCELCDFYSLDEPAVQSHVTTHRKYSKQRKVNGDDEEVKMEEDMNENEDEEGENEDDDGLDEEEMELRSSEGEAEDGSPRSKKLKRKKSQDEDVKSKKAKFSSSSFNLDIETRLKQNFCRREKIESLRGCQFYSNGLDMTLQKELSIQDGEELWPELHTSHSDWVQVPVQQALNCFPELTESVSIRSSDNKWRRFERFEGDLIEGVPVMFTGGGVRSMSWCKVSFKRMMEKTQRQYLAVSTARKVDYLRDVHYRSSQTPSLLQIWDCGVLENSVAHDSPRFSLGIVHSGGEVWDLSWFPEDTHTEATDNTLERLGLLATASEDGLVRVWSVCNPEQLHKTEGIPVYKTEPVVMLLPDEDVDEGCLQLAVGSNGIIAGGFGNGAVALWNLNNLTSPFCKKSGKSKTIRAHIQIQAHKTTVTALSFCPSNNRYISTAGLDRFVKIWDTESCLVPVEQHNKEYSLDNVWMKNWPSLIYNFDDVVLNFNKGAMKFFKDIASDRHQSTFAMEDPCLSISFSDWLNGLCGGSITGEVKLRLLKNILYDQKRTQSTVSTVTVEKLNDGGAKDGDGGKSKDGDTNKNLPRTYEEASRGFGLAFRDHTAVDKGKPKKPHAHPETFPIQAISKTAFNPNFKSFTHIALGYNCGLIRILPLKELQSSRSVRIFLEKAHKKKL